MRRANAGQSPRNDSSTFGDKLREQTNVLVVDSLDLFDAKLANLLAAKILAASTASTLARRRARQVEKTDVVRRGRDDRRQKMIQMI